MFRLRSKPANKTHRAGRCQRCGGRQEGAPLGNVKDARRRRRGIWASLVREKWDFRLIIMSMHASADARALGGPSVEAVRMSEFGTHRTPGPTRTSKLRAHTKLMRGDVALSTVM